MNSKVIIETIVSGLPEGGSAQNRFSYTNTTAVRVALETTVETGISSATTVSSPPDARTMILIPPSSNTSPYRVTGSTVEAGLPLSSQGPFVAALSPSTAGTTFYLYTSSTRAISGLRVLFY